MNTISTVHFRRASWSLSLLLLMAATTCGGDGGTTVDPPDPPEAPVATSVTISPPTARLTALGGTVQLTATVLDQNGQTMSGVTVSWASSDGSTATVSSAGLVTAVRDGSASVTATSGNASGSASVTVSQEAATVQVSPDALAFSSVGDTVRLLAAALDSNGNPVVNAGFLWASDDDAVASVDATGLVTAHRTGSARVTATSGSASGSASVTVSVELSAIRVSPAATTLFSVDDTLRLTAEGLDTNGNPVSGVEFIWTSDNEASVSVDDNGLATALKTGSAEIAATVGDITNFAAVTVAQLAVEVVMAPEEFTLTSVGATVQVTAEALDKNGNLVVDAFYTWTSTNPSVATVDSDGLVTAVGAGRTQIKAKAGGAGANYIGSSLITVALSDGQD